MIVQHATLMAGKNGFDIVATIITFQRAAPSLTSVQGFQPLFQRCTRRLMQGWIKRCADRQSARIQHVLAEFFNDVAAHFLGEIGCVG